MPTNLDHIPDQEDLRNQTVSKADLLQVLAVISNLINVSVDESDQSKKHLIGHVRQIQQRLLGH